MRYYTLLLLCTAFIYGNDSSVHALHHRTQELLEAASHKNMPDATTQLRTIATYLCQWPMYPRKSYPMPQAIAYASLEQTRIELDKLRTYINA